MNYIGVDCRISSLDFVVVNERGITNKRAKVNTGAKEFVGFVKPVLIPINIYYMGAQKEGKYTAALIKHERI